MEEIRGWTVFSSPLPSWEVVFTILHQFLLDNVRGASVKGESCWFDRFTEAFLGCALACSGQTIVCIAHKFKSERGFHSWSWHFLVSLSKAPTCNYNCFSWPRWTNGSAETEAWWIDQQIVLTLKICHTDKPPIQAKTDYIKICFQPMTNKLCWTIALQTIATHPGHAKKDKAGPDYWPADCADLNDLPYRQAPHPGQNRKHKEMFQIIDQSIVLNYCPTD